MKTISGQCVRFKEISLSKAAKVLSKFVSADNGASQVFSTYLHRSSAAFSELDQLHKDLKPSRSRKKHKMEAGGDTGRVVESSIRSAGTSQELSHGHTKCNKRRRQLHGNENADEENEKSTQTVVKFSQELNGSVVYQTGSGSNKHRSKKRKQHEVEARHDGDIRVEGRLENKSGELTKKIMKKET